MRLTPKDALRLLAGSPKRRSVELFKHGSPVLEVYKPDQVDTQAPDSRDEAYIVISGSGHFVNGGVRRPFAPGEFLFVESGVEHRFEAFSKDFATWVIFFGPEGGEAGNP
jgi:mannose-6-phosphate isomerase-like protein (cupin superfamily)